MRNQHKPTTMSKRACLPCRARKVKCIPGSQRCVRCTTLEIKGCTYDSVKKRGPGGTLGMGEACTSCRFVYHIPSSPPTNDTESSPFLCWLPLLRKRKRVSCPNYLATRFRISCILKFSRNATPNVRARHVSTPSADPVVSTRGYEPLT
ncbi:hypothetical protein BDM02DRAFT_1798514 [Thelephora ganbajun]|uniref:Uncharacterized protein n=1 Tax=Thelephora ganbajun TaxID=370292 RepID=A0ACB6Z1C1_THEGA|nr:hypothetical protein BDM02DRAFT_1798514 [Thelephora ganbajun]